MTMIVPTKVSFYYIYKQTYHTKVHAFDGHIKRIKIQHIQSHQDLGIPDANMSRFFLRTAGYLSGSDNPFVGVLSYGSDFVSVFRIEALGLLLVVEHYCYLLL